MGCAEVMSVPRFGSFICFLHVKKPCSGSHSPKVTVGLSGISNETSGRFVHETVFGLPSER